MISRMLPLVLGLLALLLLALAGCGGDGAATNVAPVTSTPAGFPTSAAGSTPPPSKAAFIQYSDTDCLLELTGDLKEHTTIIRTYVENEPKLNIDRVFQRFHQSETPSTILRCDLRTAGLFSTWWIQSLQTKEEADRLYEGFIEATAPEVTKLNMNPLSCLRIQAMRDAVEKRYTLDFTDRGLCEARVFNGKSGLVLYKTSVIGVDSQFYEELFDVIISHAQQIVDKASDQDA